MAEQCAWSPPEEKKAWCRGNAKTWAPTVLDILEEVCSGKYQGFGVHIDILSEHFLKCAIESNIDDDHIVEMHAECARQVGLRSPFGTGMVIGNYLSSILSSGAGVAATVMVSSASSARQTIFRPKKEDSGKSYEIFEESAAAIQVLERSAAADKIAQLMSEAEDTEIFYNFVVTTVDWEWQKRKGADSVLRALAKAIPSITHEVQEESQMSRFIFPPMGPETRPELGSIHVTLNRGTEEIAWHSSFMSSISINLNLKQKLAPIIIQVITTW